MIVRTLAEAEKSERCVKAENGNWQSVRLSLKEDKMGHSFNITTIFKGTKTHIKYANHWESVYVISGSGKIETLDDGNPAELANQDLQMKAKLPWLNIFGGCCGSDLRHVKQIAERLVH